MLGVVNALLVHYLRRFQYRNDFDDDLLLFHADVVTQGRSIYNLPDWFTSISQFCRFLSGHGCRGLFT